MKLENIKIESQFWALCDNWHARAHNLREVWQDENRGENKRFKAFKLWLLMIDRVNKLIPISIEIQNKKSSNFAKGGVVFENTKLRIYNNEAVINR